MRSVPGRSAITAGQARALLKQMEAEARADEAEQAVHGVRHPTAGTGDPECAGAPAELLRDAADLGAVVRRRGR